MQPGFSIDEKLTMIFSGIGVDYRKDINRLSKSEVSKISGLSEVAKDIFQIDISAYLWGTPDEPENVFLNWISIYTCDYVIYQYYLENSIIPKYLMGYSMGLITAMTCSGAISYSDGLLLLHKIYHDEVCEAEGMVTIIGLDYMQLKDLIKECHCQNTVFISCENNQYCFVISGLKQSLEKVTDLAVNAGALKTYHIDSKFAFHSPLYNIPSRDLTSSVESIFVKSIDIPIFSCIDQKIKHTATDLKEELVKNMYSKMLWGKSILALSECSIDKYLEVGLGKGLTKVSKLINLDNSFYTYNSIKKVLG